MIDDRIDQGVGQEVGTGGAHFHQHVVGALGDRLPDGLGGMFAAAGAAGKTAMLDLSFDGVANLYGDAYFDGQLALSSSSVRRARCCGVVCSNSCSSRLPGTMSSPSK